MHCGEVVSVSASSWQATGTAEVALKTMTFRAMLFSPRSRVRILVVHGYY
jgi:hypothetical protein